MKYLILILFLSSCSMSSDIIKMIETGNEVGCNLKAAADDNGKKVIICHKERIQEAPLFDEGLF